MKPLREILIASFRVRPTLLILALSTLWSPSARAQGWFSSSWTYRKPITIDSTKVGSQGAFKTWDRGAGTNNWGDANNWSPNGVPVALDDVSLTGADTIDVNVAGVSNNLTLNNTSLLLTVKRGNSLTTSGNLAVMTGTLNTEAAFPTVTGTKTLAGTITPTLNGTMTLTAGTFAAGALTIAGNLTLNGGGKLAGTGIVFLSGNWDNQGGTLEPGTSTVVFNDNSKISRVTGISTFYNLTCVTPGKTIVFEANSLTTVLGTLTIRGAEGGSIGNFPNYVTLESSIPAPGHEFGMYVHDVSDGLGNANLDYIIVNYGNAYGPAVPVQAGHEYIRAELNNGWDATFTWTGGGGNDNWSTGANWGGTAPTGVSTDALVFTGSTRLTPSNDLVGKTFASITFNAGGFTVGGQALTLAAGATAISNTVGTNTVNNNVTFSTAAPTIATTVSTTLTLGGTIANGGLLITVNTAGTLNLNGVISGTGGITKSTGTGTLTLSGANTFTGLTTISAGTLKLGASSALSTAGPLGTTAAGTTVASGATLDLNGFSLTSAATEALSLTGTGVGALGALTNSSATASTYIGVITLAAAASIEGNAGTIAITGTPASGATAITIGGAAGGSISTVIAGARTLTKEDAGTWTLSGANTFTGLTTISAGILKLGASSTLSTAGPLGTTAAGTTVTSGATLDLNGFSLTSAATEALSLSGTGVGALGALKNGSATASTYIGVITLTAAASIVGQAGTIAVTGTPASGITAITLGGSAGGSISTVVAGARTLTKEGTGTWTLSGANTFTGTTTISTGTVVLQNLSASATVSISSGAVYELNRAVALDYTTAVTFNGAGTLRKTGAGTVQWNPIVGTFALSSGSLIDVQGGMINATGGGPSVWTNNFSDLNVASGAIFGIWANDIRVDAISGSGQIKVGAAGVGSLTIGVDNGTGSDFSGVISDNTSAGNIIKTGTGTQTLSGANTYTGLTTISAGTLKLGASSAVSTAGPLGTTAGGTTVSSGATLDLNGFSLTSAATEALSVSGTGVGALGALTNSSSTASTYIGVITFTAAASIEGNAGTIAITGTPASGATAITIGGAAGGSISTVIAGARTLTKEDAGTWTVSGANTFTGAVTISAGTLSVNTVADAATNSALGTGSVTPAISLGGTGTLQYTGTGHSANRALTLTGTGATIDASGSGTLTLTGGVTGNAYNLNLIGTGNGVESGVIATTTGTLTKSGAGAWTLAGANTYSGTTTISAGSLQLGNGATTGSLSTSSAITDNATLTFNRSNTLTQGTDFNSLISGTGGVTQAGSGTTILNGANTFSGAVTINAGTLQLGASSAVSTAGPLGTTAGGTSVAIGATLDLNGFSLTSAATEALSLSGTGVGALGALTNSSATGSTYIGVITFAAAASIVGEGGTIAITGTPATGATAITIGGSAGGSIATVIDGARSLTKEGSGTWTLTADNTYTLWTWIVKGTLSVPKLADFGVASPLGAPTTVANRTIFMNTQFGARYSSTLLYTGTGHTTNREFWIDGTAIIDQSGSGLLKFTGVFAPESAFQDTLVLQGSAGGTGEFAGTLWNGIDGGWLAVVKAGTSTWTLSGVNTYTLSTTISAGILKLGASSTLSTSSPLGTTAAGTTVSSGAALDLNGFSLTSAATEALSLSGTGVGGLGALTNGSATASTYIGVITFAAAASIVGESGTIAVTGTPASGATAITIGGSAGGSVSTVIAGARTLTKEGTGTWTLSGASTYTLGSTLTAGTLQLNNSAGLGAAGQAIALNGGTLNLHTDATVNAYNTTVGGTVTIVSDRATSGAGITHALGTLSIGAQTLTVNKGTNVASGTAAVSFGNLTLSGAATFNTGTADVLMTGSETGNFKLTKSGAGTLQKTTAGWTLPNAFEITAGTYDANGQTTTVTGLATVSGGEYKANTAAQTFNAGLTISGGTFTGLSGTAGNVTTTALTLSSGTLSAPGSTGTFNVSGDFSNSGTFTHNSGTVTLNGVTQAIGGSAATAFSNLTIANTTTTVNTSFSAAANLTVNAGAIVTPAAAVVVSGAGTLTGSGTVQVTRTAATADFSSQYTIATKTLTNLTVEYVGASAQVISALTYGGLKMNNASGVTMGGSATVNGTLTLTSGIITAGASSLIISSTGSVARTSGHVFGNFQKWIATGATSKTFESGGATNYTPVDVAFASVSVAGNLTAAVTVGDHPNIGSTTLISSKSVNRYWALTNSGITFTSYGATFTFVAGDVDAGANTAIFIGAKYSAGWTYPTVGTRTALTTQITGATSFGEFQLGEPGAPNMTLGEAVNPSGTQPPGTDLAYTTTFTNIGTIPAQVVAITDPISANTDFKVGSETHNLGTTGLTVVVAYSNDGGSTWTYTPVSAAGGAPAGYDRVVTHVRWTFTGSLSQTGPNNTGTTGLTMRIR